MIAAGAWTPQLVSMIASAEAPELAGSAIQPRKGHLLEVPAALAPAVKHGLMEIGYAKVCLRALNHVHLGRDSSACIMQAVHLGHRLIRSLA